MTSKRKLIIDTDGVADDIRAVSLALQHPDVEVLAITTTHGCVRTEQAAANVARALRANGVKVPIYKGATTQFIRNIPVKEKTWDESVFFGKDGIGGQPTAFPEVLESDFSCWEKEHAAQALIRLTREHENVTIVAIGCLTNLALALKLDDGFKRQLEGMVIMGGNYYGMGNVDSQSSAEFNFHGDPEAASIVLSELECPITVVPWEMMREGKKLQEVVDFDAHLKLGTPLSDFLATATSTARGRLALRGSQYQYCDELAVAIAIDAQRVITNSLKLRVAVELRGQFTRGQVMVDWIDQIWAANESESNDRGVDKTRRRVTFVTAYDVHVVDGMMMNACRMGKKE